MVLNWSNGPQDGSERIGTDLEAGRTDPEDRETGKRSGTGTDLEKNRPTNRPTTAALTRPSTGPMVKGPMVLNRTNGPEYV